jgi:hypothetical protein
VSFLVIDVVVVGGGGEGGATPAVGDRQARHWRTGSLEEEEEDVDHRRRKRRTSEGDRREEDVIRGEVTHSPLSCDGSHRWIWGSISIWILQSAIVNTS